jgi:hypothetical protein
MYMSVDLGKRERFLISSSSPSPPSSSIHTTAWRALAAAAASNTRRHDGNGVGCGGGEEDKLGILSKGRGDSFLGGPTDADVKAKGGANDKTETVRSTRPL